jgi:purine-binding chemotaxis protein CheW
MPMPPDVQSSSSPAGARHLVAFRLQDALFGVDIMQVHRVLMPQPLVSMPGAPEAVRGMFDLHGTLVAVVDTGRLLRSPAGEREETGRRLVVVRIGEETLVALQVDEVVERVRLAEEQILPPPPQAQTPAVVGAFYREEELGLVLDPALLLGEEAAGWIA